MYSINLEVQPPDFQNYPKLVHFNITGKQKG